MKNVLVDLGGKLGPVREGASHIPADDVVEFEGVGPFLFDVVYLELYVWWDPFISLVFAMAVRASEYTRDFEWD